MDQNICLANTAGTCERHTCECDKELRRATIDLTYDTNQENAECEASSPSGPPGPSSTGCCPMGQLLQFYNTNSHECCAGTVVDTNTCV